MRRIANSQSIICASTLKAAQVSLTVVAPTLFGVAAYRPSRPLLNAAHQTASGNVPVAANSEVSHNDEASSADDHDWREPTLADLDRSMPQVDCDFVSKLIKSRTARLVKHRKHQMEIFNKVLRYKEEEAGHRPSEKGAVKPPATTDGAPLDGANVASAAMTKTESEVTSLATTASSSTTLNAGNSPSAALLKKALDADGDELVEKGILTEEEWDVYAHSRPEYDDEYLLIDCRTVNEITSWGIIEGAKVLPAHEMYDAFKLTPEDFEEEFGFAKPHPSQKIIFYCQYGARSLMAAQILSYLGYPNVLVLREGYHEWAKQYNLLLRRWFEHNKVSGNDLERRALFVAAKELQREIAPEFNELPLLEAERLEIDETRSKGTMLIGEGLRRLCYDEVEKISSGIEHEDLKLPPSLSEQVKQRLIDSPLFASEDAIAKRQRAEGTGIGGASRATTGDSNPESSPQGLFNFMLQTTGMETDNVSSNSRSPSATVGMGGVTPTVADANRNRSVEEGEDVFTVAFNDFSKDPPYIGADTAELLHRQREAAAARERLERQHAQEATQGNTEKK